MSAIPEIDDAQIAAMCAQMGLPEGAFGTAEDERFQVFKDRQSIDVCACPGSGKTTLLVAKLGAIMSKWNSSGQGVCVLSHTTVARNEIGRKLGATSAGNKLLSHPHFVGTIHGFMNEFLAVPWIKANGYKIKTIDTGIALEKRWYRLPYKTRTYLEQRKRLSRSVMQAASSAIDIAGLPFKSSTETYRAMVAALKTSFDEGIFTHEEMLMWATDLLNRRPDVSEVIRARFPCVFIDEAQDTTAIQSTLLNRIFSERGSGVVVQRFGDSNQAIYGADGESGDIPARLMFPQESLKRELPKSLRFDQTIADLADPLGLVPYKMQGHRTSLLNTLTASPKHTIFLFDDEEGGRRVPDAFADLLSVTFCADDLGKGLFKAVGQVHSKGKDDNFPRSVGNYCDFYDPSPSKNESNPRTMLEHVLHGRTRSLESGNSFPAIDGLANGVLRVLDLMDFEVPPMLSGRRNRHRKLIEILSGKTELLESYAKLYKLVGHDQLDLTKVNWEGEVEPLVKSVVEPLTDRLSKRPDVMKFIGWSDLNTISALSRSSSTGNISVFDRNGVAIPVQFGSIHSVKGETHTATLVLETFFFGHNIASISKWFTGEKGGGGGASVTNVKRLQLHYVAMTRPSHLICLGVHAPSMIANSKKKRTDLIEALTSRGWAVVEM